MNASAGLPVPRIRRHPIRWISLIAAAVAVLILTAPGRSAPSSPRAYAQQVAAQRYGWTGGEFAALDSLVRRESGWDPCAYNPGGHNCSYTGTSSCGIPQAYPCPAAWRGRLGSTWRAQVDWLLAYIHGRYGSPSTAWAEWLARSPHWY